MGNCCSVEGAIDHWIYVKTGDRKGSGTDANVRAILYDNAGHESPVINLDCYFQNDYERGKTEVFQAPPLKDFGAVAKVEVWRDNTDVRADWFCEVVVVNDRRTDRWFYFPLQRWMVPQRRYVVCAYDTALPQLDENRRLREKDLEERRMLYQYAQRAPDLPVQIKSIPADELFSEEFKWDIVERMNALLANTSLAARPWGGLADLSSCYTYPFDEPTGIDNWSNDVCFGAQRLTGCNPTMIRRCSELPENLGITAEMLQPFLEGWTLRQIIQADRLFLVDLKILEDLPTVNDNRLCCPLGLFFVNGDKQLLPIAIQLYQQITPDNPVFLPNDPPFTWLLAKMWFNNADATVHQCLSHIGFTNMLMEGVCIAMHRNLSSSHPVFRLLAPHFLFLIGINASGMERLISPRGWLDNCTTVGREGLLELIRRGTAEWRIDVNGSLPRDLKSRGLLDQNILPYYGYRDDGLLIYNAIEGYIKEILEHYYDTANKITEDYELQNWGRDLALSRDEGGVGINGMPPGGRFRHRADLVLICTSIIFTCSAQHMAVNASQYNEYAFPPNYPIYLAGQPPTDRLPRSEEDLVVALANKACTMETMAFTRLLSAATGPSLGQWNFQFQYDPPAVKAEKRFREELQKISEMVKERNVHRPHFYKYTNLDPKNIPSSICI
ncbi:hypothetical protein NP493_128g05087 [Ridgeia piscesae]|uniref:Uncharacterized protein n=1 Tax=Ridgeia piscesae TaxID=27915 RepID=A0AAD9P5K3_RIDPI|nr:hypothetical protein NP493_128g05087 [Ridgeia piscesae]